MLERIRFYADLAEITPLGILAGIGALLALAAFIGLGVLYFNAAGL